MMFSEAAIEEVLHRLDKILSRRKYSGKIPSWTFA
jgi:hypothetical protein